MPRTRRTTPTANRPIRADLHVRVDADLHHRLKLRAVEERRSLADLVEAILRSDLGRRKGGAR